MSPSFAGVSAPKHTFLVQKKSDTMYKTYGHTSGHCVSSSKYMYLLKILDIYIYLVHFSTYFITLGHFKKMYKIAGQFLSSCLIHFFKAS